MSAESPVKPKLLLTGACGVVGSQIVQYLKPHFELVLTDIRAGNIAGIPVQAVDITKFHQILEAAAGVEYIVHLAIASGRRMAHMPQDEVDDMTMMVNVLGTQHVFEAARLQGVKRVVFISSMTVFLGDPQLDHVGDGTPVRPANLYACTKLFGEHLAELYARRYKLPVVCLRLGQPIPIEDELPYETLKEWHSLCSIVVAYEDIAAAIMGALKPEAPRHAVVHVFSASEYTRFEHCGADKIGFRPSVFFTPDGPSPVRECSTQQG